MFLTERINIIFFQQKEHFTIKESLKIIKMFLQRGKKFETEKYIQQCITYNVLQFFYTQRCRYTT